MLIHLLDDFWSKSVIFERIEQFVVFLSDKCFWVRFVWSLLYELVCDKFDRFKLVQLLISRTWLYLQVSLSKMHGIFLTSSGHVYACGHGRGGRLGTGNEQTLITPKKLAFPQVVSLIVSPASYVNVHGLRL